MPLPPPLPGTVVHYEYLWRDEARRGEERGLKRRPCAIVLCVTDAAGRKEVTVAPITHSPPRAAGGGVPLPPRVKRALGLDEAPSWVVTTDLNVFEWPGIDLYPVPGAGPGTYEYGMLPPLLFDEVVRRVRAAGGFGAATYRMEG